MEVNFCSNCEMLSNLLENEENKLYWGCKNCGNIDEFKIENGLIYSNDYDIDLSETINNNKYIAYDNTLPIIKNNKNIKCPNSDCESVVENKESNILYIKYDIKDMKYMYICKYCGIKWLN